MSKFDVYALRILTGVSLIVLVSISPAIAQVRPNPPTGVLIEGGSVVPSGGGVVLFDDFEFAASRSGVTTSQFTARGWTGIKAQNLTERRAGGGYIYTQYDATLGSNILVLESRPSETDQTIPGFFGGQTDYYLEIGNSSAGLETIPANVWLLFWTYATPESRFSSSDKVLYPTRDTYPSSSLGWILLWGRTACERNDFQAPLGGRFICVRSGEADNQQGYDPGYDPAGNQKLYQNMSQTPMLAGRWYQLKLHFDTSGAQGVYQAWIRERGQSNWTMVADWRGGITPMFTWPLSGTQRAGHSVMRMPTTVNGTAGDSTTYVDDFLISDSEP